MQKGALVKRSILVKMLLQTLLPILIVFCVAGFLILNTVKESMTTLVTDQLTSKSQAASYQIGDFFTRYTEIVRQMATNSEVKKILTANKDKPLKETPGFDGFLETMQNIAATDSENILYSWIVDVDPSVYVQSDGPVSAVGEWDVTGSSWYQQVVNSDEVVVTEPYMSTAGQMVVSIVKRAVDESNNVLGFVAIDLSIDKLNKMMEAYQLGDTGFFVLTSKQGMLLHYPDENYEGKNISETDASKTFVDALTSETAQQMNYNAMGQSVYGYISPVGKTGWCVATGLPEKEYFSSYSGVSRTIIIVFAFCLILLFAITVVLARGITSPLKKLSKAAGQIAMGELDVKIDVKTKDETGQVASALVDTVARLKDYINYIDEISYVLNQMASGNLVFELTYDYSGEFKKVEEALIHISDFLNETLSNINRSADQVSNGAMQMSSGAQALSQGATQQASSIEELSATIAEISRQIKDNAENADDASRKADAVGNDMIASNQQMQELMNAMDRINSSSLEIGKIIKAIEDIAFQTNILALNAAVEAARAGAAGKGFAVVADEVRNLAGKSAEASKSTAELIETSIKAVDDGTRIAKATAGTLVTVVQGANDVVKTITEISKASNNQAEFISQVAQGVEQISSVVQTNSATAEESAATSEELSAQSNLLKGLVEQFKLKH